MCWGTALILLAGCTGRPLDLNRTPAASTPTMVQAIQPTAPLQPGVVATPPEQTRSPETPTIMPTATQGTTPTPAPAETAILVLPVPAATPTNEQRWRARQRDRRVVQPVQLYVARRPARLLWFDPRTSQVLDIGNISGTFPVQATFQFLGQTQVEEAVEVPYTINRDFGLTAISEAVRQRMAAAGYTETVEAFVVLNDSIVPQP